MAIDQILDEALHERHVETAQNLLLDSLEMRGHALEKFYKMTLNDMDRAKFESLEPIEKAERLRLTGYKFTPEITKQMVGYVSVAVLRRISETLGNLMQDAINAAYNTHGATDEQRANASRDVNHFKIILRAYGFDPDRMEETGREQGFTLQMWQNSFQNLPQQYLGHHMNAAMGLISDEQAEQYMRETIRPATGMDPNIALAQGRQSVNEILLAFRRYQNDNNLGEFRNQYQRYHPEAQN